MKFGRPASLTLRIMNWQKLFVLVLCCLVKSHSVQSHLCVFTHTLPNSHLDMRSDHYWPANSSPHLWFMSAPMSERIKSWSVCACVCTCDRLCEHKFMAAYISEMYPRPSWLWLWDKTWSKEEVPELWVHNSGSWRQLDRQVKNYHTLLGPLPGKMVSNWGGILSKYLHHCTFQDKQGL